MGAHQFYMEQKLEVNYNQIPDYVTRVTTELEKAGFEAFLVGGCVRDLILGREIKDWDITTNATPEQIQAIFEKTVYENNFGTVGVCIEDNIIEVTTYRKEAKYTDFRHPDEVSFTRNIEDDLKRRDFTMNAIALSSKGQITDLFDGIKDIKNKVVMAVGNPTERFTEDALRVLRAVRFATVLHTLNLH